jgi:hypothetical protein
LRSDPVRQRRSAKLVGKLFSPLAPLRALSIAVTEKLVRGESPVVEAALAKELGTTVEQLIPTLIADALFGESAEQQAQIPTELLLTLNYLTLIAPSFSLRGGTRDILRGMIARGLGLR